MKGHPVLVHVHGFLPYFFVHAPRGFTQVTCGDFKNYLNTTFGAGSVSDISLESKKNLMQYTGAENIAFIKITISDLRHLARIRGSFERGEIGFRDLFVSGEPSVSFDNVAYTLRFMIDLNIVGMNWIEIKAGHYSVRPPNACISRCQVEVDCQCVYLLLTEDPKPSFLTRPTVNG